MMDSFVPAVRTLILLICSYACLSCQASEKATAIDRLLETAAEQTDVPGVVAMAASSEGIIYQGAFGKSDLGAGNAMAVDAIFAIASMTKPVTSVAAMQLVEAGKLKLDRPIAEYLPRLNEVKVLTGFDSNGIAVLATPRNPITLRKLLNHTSGFVYEFWNAGIKRLVDDGRLTSILEPGDAFLSAPVAFEPGTKWEYGISTDWIGVLIEAVSGQPLDQYFREHIFEPLRMVDTYFSVPPDKQYRVVSVYSRAEDGGLVALEPFTPNPFLSGGGGLSSTAGDYIRLMRMFLQGGILDGVRVLNEETVDLMAANQTGELEIGTMQTAMPFFSNDFDFFPGSSSRFGLGFLINTRHVPGGRLAGSLSWAGLFNTYFWIDRERDICAVLMTQILPFYDARTVQLLENFEQALYRHQ
jgi:CubicO group peptidase (beta-lactamase class C family)